MIHLQRRQALGLLAMSALGAHGQAWAQPASAAAQEAQAPAMPAVGSVLSVPRIVRLDGTVFEPAQSQGRTLLVYWWASTCPFCALQSPSMEVLWRQQRDKGWDLLALSVDRQPAAAQAYLKARGYTFPSAWASPEWRKTFPKPRGLPITLVRGRDGRVLQADKGQMFDEDVMDLAKHS